jgi:hypothetical protein
MGVNQTGENQTGAARTGIADQAADDAAGKLHRSGVFSSVGKVDDPAGNALHFHQCGAG